MGLGCSSVEEHRLSMWEAPSLIPSNTHTKKKPHKPVTILPHTNLCKHPSMPQPGNTDCRVQEGCLSEDATLVEEAHQQHSRLLNNSASHIPGFHHLRMTTSQALSVGQALGYRFLHSHRWDEGHTTPKHATST